MLRGIFFINFLNDLYKNALFQISRAFIMRKAWIKILLVYNKQSFEVEEVKKQSILFGFFVCLCGCHHFPFEDF
jgi:hypothetical protein